MLAALSLIVAELGWRYNPKANFYFTPSRIYELLAGALCTFVPQARPGVKSNLLSGLGLAMIVGAILTFDESLTFPSLYTLVPVTGSALIILFAAPHTWTARLLSLRLLVGIGLISYSAYLWHQPLFVFARLSSIEPPATILLTALAAASLVLAYLSWRFIEQPFRRGPVFGFGQRRFIFSASIAGAAAFILAVSISENTKYFEITLNEKGKYYYSYMTYHKSTSYQKQYREPKCFYGSAQNSFSYFDQDLCVHFKPGLKNYIVIGDSQAAHLWYAINEAFPAVNVMQASASGCVPVTPYRGRKRCTDLVRFIFDTYIVENKVDGIILSGRWKVENIPQFAATIAHLKKFVPNVIVLGPNVQFATELPVILGANSDAPMLATAAKARSLVRSREYRITDGIAAATQGTGATFVPLLPHVCGPDVCTVLADNGEPLIFDKAHFTLGGAISTINRMRDAGALSLN